MSAMPALAKLLLSLVVTIPPASQFVARQAAGPPITGAIDRINADLSVAFEGEAAAKIAAGELISLRRKGRVLPPPPAGPHVVFANGDRLAGEVVAIENDKVRLKAKLGRDMTAANVQEMALPLSALAVIWFQAPPDDADEAVTRFAGERRRRDVVLAKNGDTRSGTLREMKSTAGPLVLTEDGKEVRLDPAQLVAIAMNTELARTLRPRDAYARLTLANGGRLGVLAPESNLFDLSAKTLFGESLKVPLDQLVSLDVRQGKAVYLSDLKPKAYEHRPYLGVRWPYAMDHEVSGGAIRLGGGYYDKGVGLHSESKLTFALDGRYRRFEALVGLDNRTGRGGRAIVRVLVDGAAKPIGEPELTSASPPRLIEIDVTNARELTLAVDFGPAGDVGDHVDWAEARLVK
jgi:hypothetical protein